MGEQDGVASVYWEASPAGDVIADSVVALLMHAQSSAAAIRITSKPCNHPRDEERSLDQGNPEKKSRQDVIESRLRFLHQILKDQFMNVEAVFEGSSATFEIVGDGQPSSAEDDNENIGIGCTVRIEFLDSIGENAKVSVESADDKLGQSVRDCLQLAATAADPLAH